MWLLVSAVGGSKVHAVILGIRFGCANCGGCLLSGHRKLDIVLSVVGRTQAALPWNVIRSCELTILKFWYLQDEEDRPRKEVPRWAVKENLILSIHTQLLTPVSLDEMFDGARPEKVDLPAIFQKKSDRYNRRGSSQMWTHGVLPLGVSTPHHHPSKAKDDVNF